MPFKKVFSAFCLIVTAWACLATSVARESVDSGSFYINSDCTTPPSEMAIAVTANQITAPGGVNYTNFGFPQNIVALGTPVVGIVGLATRECVDTYSTTDGDRYIFTCKDNGTYACTIMLTGQ